MSLMSREDIHRILHSDENIYGVYSEVSLFNWVSEYASYSDFELFLDDNIKIISVYLPLILHNIFYRPINEKLHLIKLLVEKYKVEPCIYDNKYVLQSVINSSINIEQKILSDYFLSFKCVTQKAFDLNQTHIINTIKLKRCDKIKSILND